MQMNLDNLSCVHQDWESLSLAGVRWLVAFAKFDVARRDQ